MSLENLKRNKEIFTKYQNGKTHLELAEEYGISRVRIRQILHHERSYNTRERIDIPEIKQACEEFDAPIGMYYRIVNALVENRVDKHNKWKRLSRPQILSIRNLGEKAADILQFAQKIAR